MMARSPVASFLFLLCSSNVAAFSLTACGKSVAADSTAGSRRKFLTTSVATIVGGTPVAGLVSQPQPSYAATAREIITTPSGIKYAVTKEPSKGAVAPLKGDIVAIDYTGYLSNGQ